MSGKQEVVISIEGKHKKKAEGQNMIDPLLANARVAPVYTRLKESIAEANKYPKDVQKADIDRAKEKPKIQRVPDILKEQKKFQKHYEPPWIEQTKFEKYYEPRWISIGPIHHDKPKVKLAEKKYKPELVMKFIIDSGSEIEALYKIIKDRIGELKKCFDEDVIKDYDDDTLSWMLFFDGCSTLQFISSYVKGELNLFSIKNDQVAYAQQDLFLLENQIPFLVLKLLMECQKDADRETLKNSIEMFIRLNVMTPKKYKKKLIINIETNQEPTHLLELLRLAILEQPKKRHTFYGLLGGLLTCPLDKVASSSPCQKFWPFTLFKDKEPGQQSFRSVQDLKSGGIDLKPSWSCSLRDVTFTSLCFAGRLRLPPITVDDSTGSRFLNLIAYEMCPDNFRTNYEVTSYICFLDSLIDYPNDVKELRSSHILHNRLGCDKEVAQLFNEIGTDLVPSNEVYEKVIVQVQKHYKSKWRTSMAEVFHEHFSSPWTIVAFLAAAVALGMSGVQTWYTIHPSQSAA